MKAAIVQTIILAALFVGTLAAQGKTDVVVMKNGDRMTCEIKGLSDGVLYVKLDYVDGTISINWSQVARLESKRLFIVKTENGTVYSGKLSTAPSTDDRPIKIEIEDTATTKTAIDSEKVVTMDTTSKRIWDRFNGDINAGLTYAKGNQSTQYNISSSVEYPTDRWIVQASFSSALAASNGSDTSKRNQLNLGARRLMRRENYFYAGVASFLQSSEQGIKLQTSLGGGIGHYFKNTNRARIALIGGIGWQRTKYTDSPNAQNSSAAIISGELRIFRFKKTNLNVNATLLPSLSEPGRVYFKVNESFYIKLYSNLSWNLSFYGSWDNRPPVGLPSSDYGTTTGLGWTFGNK